MFLIKLLELENKNTHITVSVFVWSGRRDSNSRPSPWQGDALPLSHFRKYSGDKRNRTVDPLLARQVLSQLSYTPIKAGDGTRTRDLLTTSQLLCQLSYTGQCSRALVS